MTTLENYPLHPDDQLPAFWLSAIQEMLAAMAPQLVLSSPTTTSLRIAGGSGLAGRMGAPVGGLWRYVDTDKDTTHPGGAAGNYPIWLVVSANRIDVELEDTTDYSIYPRIMAPGVTPTGNTPAGDAIVASRQIGLCEWSGTAITGFWQFTGAVDSTMPIKPTPPNAQAWAIKCVADAAHSGAFVTFQAGTTHVLDLQVASAVFGVPVTFSATVSHNADLVLGNNKNIVMGTGGGTRIGTAANQMIGFWGATPVVQPLAPAQPPVNVATHLTSGFPSSLTAASTLNDVIAVLSRVIAYLQEQGLLGSGQWAF